MSSARRARRRWLMHSGRSLHSPALPIGAGILAGAAGAGVVVGLGGGTGGALAGFAAGLIVVAAPIVAAQKLARRVVEETHRIVNMRSLMGDELLGSGWAMDAAFAFDITDLVDRLRPGLVFECGSGQSTLLIAQRLRRIGSGRVVSVEHQGDWAAQTREQVAAAGLSDFATVLHAPLVEREIDGEVHRWYAPVYESHLTGKIDLLVVDGPPRGKARLARYPAVPALRQHMSDSATVLLDDGDRASERTIARRWAGESGASLRYLPIGKGRWLLQLPPRNGTR